MYNFKEQRKPKRLSKYRRVNCSKDNLSYVNPIEILVIIKILMTNKVIKKKNKDIRKNHRVTKIKHIKNKLQQIVDKNQRNPKTKNLITFLATFFHDN